MKKLMTSALMMLFLLLGCNTADQNQSEKEVAQISKSIPKDTEPVVPLRHIEDLYHESDILTKKLPDFKKYTGFSWQEFLDSKIWSFYTYPQQFVKTYKGYIKNEQKIRDVCFESGLLHQFTADVTADEDKIDDCRNMVSCLLACGSHDQPDDIDSCLYYTGPVFLSSVKDSRKFIDNVVYKIFCDPQLQEIVYEWALPSYKEAFLQLPEKFQQYYLDGLEQAKVYAENFDYEKEKAWSKNGWFSTYASEEDWKSQRSSPYRSIEAFIFRRIDKKQMTIGQVKDWLNRIDAEVKSWMFYQ